MIEIWTSRTKAVTLVSYITCTFDPVVCKVVLRLFGVLVSKRHVTHKRLVIERNGVKTGTQRDNSNTYTGIAYL